MTVADVPVSQAALARAAGLHRITVTRALADDPGVAEATRRRVQQLAQQLGYRPNGAARAMRDRRFNAVGLVTRSDGSMPRDLLVGLGESASRHGLNLMVSILSDEVAAADSKRLDHRMLNEQCVDGLLLHHVMRLDNAFIDDLHRRQIPAVVLNHNGEHDCVYPADFEAGVDSGRRLARLGHRRVGYFTFVDTYSPKQHYSWAARRNGLKQGLQAHGATLVEYNRPVDWMTREGRVLSPVARQVVDDVLGRGVTAVVAGGHQEAEAIRQALQERGVRPMVDVALAAFAWEPFLHSEPEPWIIRVPMRQVAAMAVDVLVRRLDAGRPQPSVAVGFTENDIPDAGSDPAAG